MDSDPDRPVTVRNGKPVSVLLVLTGSLLIIFSLLHIARIMAGPVKFLEGLNVRPDIIAGGILFLEGSLLVVGGYKLLKGKEDGIAFAWIGWLTGLLLSSVSALVLLSNTFSSVVLSVDGMEDWTAADDVVPGLYLGLVLIVLLPAMVKYGRGPGQGDRGRSQR